MLDYQRVNLLLLGWFEWRWGHPKIRRGSCWELLSLPQESQTSLQDVAYILKIGSVIHSPTQTNHDQSHYMGFESKPWCLIPHIPWPFWPPAPILEVQWNPKPGDCDGDPNCHVFAGATWGPRTVVAAVFCKGDTGKSSKESWCRASDDGGAINFVQTEGWSN